MIVIMDKLKKILDDIFKNDNYENCEDFIGAGLLDSMDIVELVEHLEEAYDIEISGRDIVPDNFSNIASIENLIEKYMEEEDD
jgi:acyl carrier protein